MKTDKLPTEPEKFYGRPGDFYIEEKQSRWGWLGFGIITVALAIAAAAFFVKSLVEASCA